MDHVEGIVLFVFHGPGWTAHWGIHLTMSLWSIQCERRSLGPLLIKWSCCALCWWHQQPGFCIENMLYALCCFHIGRKLFSGKEEDPSVVVTRVWALFLRNVIVLGKMRSIVQCFLCFSNVGGSLAAKRTMCVPWEGSWRTEQEREWHGLIFKNMLSL